MTNINHIINLIKSINWIRAKDHYVIIDPIDSNAILYVRQNQYERYVGMAMSNHIDLVCLARPDDDLQSALAHYGVKSDGSTPPLNDLKAKLSSMFTLRDGWVVRESMIRFKRNFKSFLPTYYRDIRSWLGLKNPLFAFSAIQIMGRQMEAMRAKSNINFVILYLKVASIATLQYIAGNPLKSTQALGKRISLSHGLPTIIPSRLRKLIREGDKTTIIVVSTLLHAFKGFEGVNMKPSLGSIEAPHAHSSFGYSTWRLRRDSPSWSNNFEPGWFNNYDPNDETRPTPAERLTWPMIRDEILKSRSLYKNQELNNNLKAFWSYINPKRVVPDLLHSFPVHKLMLSAGPLNGTSILGSHFDALIIARVREVRELFEDYITCADEVQVRYEKSRVNPDTDILSEIETVGNKLYSNLILKSAYSRELQDLRVKAKPFGFTWNDNVSVRENLDNMLRYLPRGKLAFKNEAAGKVRVFALGDYWSQLMLKPLHDSIFRILKHHPCDATFDQIGKVKEFSQRNYRFIASYDLKSATDLIPQHLYEDVLSEWTSRAFAGAWLEILVNRVYLVPKSKHLVKRTAVYTRGQPMGMLSSWASLALVHHYLVFLASQRAKQYNFYDYLVLGDDIVIANESVARHYTEVCLEYGITIGLAKSYVSTTGFFQFASQNMMGQDNISPLSLKEVLMCSAHALYFGPSTSLSAKVEWIRRLKVKEQIGDGLICSLKAIMTFTEWKRFSSFLTKGIIPSRHMNAIVSILASDFKSYTNTVHLDGFLAALRGEYGSFTGKFKEDALMRYNYTNALFNYLKQSLVTLLVKAKRSSHGELYDSYALKVKAIQELPPELKFVVEPALNELVDQHAEKFQEIFAEWRLIEAKFDELNTLELWTTLYLGPVEGRQEFPVSLLAEALSLIEKARSLVLEKTLIFGAIAKVHNLPRLMILHRSLLHRISAVTITGRGLTGGC